MRKRIDTYNRVLQFDNYEDAFKFAEKIQAGELDGWTYKPKAIDSGFFVIEVRDEVGEFVVEWFEPTDWPK